MSLCRSANQVFSFVPPLGLLKSKGLLVVFEVEAVKCPCEILWVCRQRSGPIAVRTEFVLSATCRGAYPQRDRQAGIRISSIERLPERVDIDTSLPTIVPSPTVLDFAQRWPVARSKRSQSQ